MLKPGGAFLWRQVYLLFKETPCFSFSLTSFLAVYIFAYSRFLRRHTALTAAEDIWPSKLDIFFDHFLWAVNVKLWLEKKREAKCFDLNWIIVNSTYIRHTWHKLLFTSWLRSFICNGWKRQSWVRHNCKNCKIVFTNSYCAVIPRPAEI